MGCAPLCRLLGALPQAQHQAQNRCLEKQPHAAVQVQAAEPPCRQGGVGPSRCAEQAGELPPPPDFKHCRGTQREVTTTRVQSAQRRSGPSSPRRVTPGFVFAQSRWNGLSPCRAGASASPKGTGPWGAERGLAGLCGHRDPPPAPPAPHGLPLSLPNLLGDQEYLLVQNFCCSGDGSNGS